MDGQKRLSDTYEDGVIVAVVNFESKHTIQDQILELKELAHTAGVNIINTITQNRNSIEASTYIGKGKIKSIINNAIELKCKCIIINDELSPSQIKNIQKIAGDKLKIIDRTGLIIDIFYKHAKTNEAKTQVEIARLKYLLPRLTRQWTHLERQMGGVGTRGGPGETQIEIDRRLIRDKISVLNKRLKKIEIQRQTQAHHRSSVFKVAIVGYTNAGKSTLMKNLTNTNVYVQNQLFATLDTTTRKIEKPNSTRYIISDTVGFIRNLPHDLVASFKSTLSEVSNADLLIKVFDASSKEISLHHYIINEILTELNAKDIPYINVANKVDLVEDPNDLMAISKDLDDPVFISASNCLNIKELEKRYI